MSDAVRLGAFLVLIFAVMASAIGVVYSKHLSRTYFVELQALEGEVMDLETEWGRLQLEQSAWTDHGRIERLARERLNMRLPQQDEVIFIKP